MTDAPATPPPLDLITTAEACQLLGVKDRSTVRVMVLSGKLTPAVRLAGRLGYLFDRDHVLAVAQARAEQRAAS